MSRFVLVAAWIAAAALVPPLAHAVDGEWSAEGQSTYTGSWTITTYDTEAPADVSMDRLGESVPGALTVDCRARDGYCSMTGSHEELQWFVVSGEVVGAGQLRLETEEELDNCGGGQINRAVYEATFGPSEASATQELTADPLTCEDGDGTLYSTNMTWSFEGLLTEHVAPAADDLAAFLASYGMTCADADGANVCQLVIGDGDGDAARPDAIYEVTIRGDPAGDVVGVDATVTSLDESMPSDAIGFLRGVAERVPANDTEGLLAWLDGAVAGSAEPYEGDGWTASWADAVEGSGRVLRLAVARAGQEAPPAASEGAAPQPTSPPPAAPAAGPGAFAASIPRPAAVSTDPAVLLQSAALAALLVFLMPFPSQLFNSTLEAHEQEVRRWFRLDRIGAAVAGTGAFWTTWPGVILFALLAALLYGFLDPGFGLDLGSLAAFVGMLGGIVLVTAAFAVPVVLAHRRIGDRWRVQVVPISLLVGVACVLVSRLTGFQPGYLYGLLIGLAFARELSAAEEGRATAIGAGTMLAVAVIAWLGLGALPDGDAFELVAVRTSLAALLVAGLEGVVFGLLPMRFLPGEPLYRWNRLAWSGLLALGAFAFFHILINPASGYLSDTSRTPLLTVVALLLGFSVVSVAFWAWFRFRPDPAPAVDA